MLLESTKIVSLKLELIFTIIILKGIRNMVFVVASDYQ